MCMTSRETSLFKFLERKGHVLDGGCMGSGHCGRCRVKYLDCAPEAAEGERRFFSQKELEEGYRLACMHPADESARVEVWYVKAPGIDIVTGTPEAMAMERGGESSEKSAVRAAAKKETSEKAGGPWRIAIDLGTTTIAMQARTAAGAVLGEWKCMNPQRRFGNDVVSRMAAALEGSDQALKACVEKVLAAGIDALVQTVDRGEPEGIYLAGNTVMEHLLAGLSVEGLSRFPFQPVPLEEQEISLQCRDRERRVTLLPGLSAFVGADLLAGVIACGMHRSEKVSLLVDLGTNGELVLGNKDRLMCTATAAGPAFEGGANGRMAGSDVIAMIAKMLAEEIVDETGLLAEPWFDSGVAWNRDRSGFVLPDAEVPPATGPESAAAGANSAATVPESAAAGANSAATVPEGEAAGANPAASVPEGAAAGANPPATVPESTAAGANPTASGAYLTQEDIRAIQMAKSAVYAGIKILIREYGITPAEVEHVWLAGGFGYYLDVKSAAAIGLFPQELADRVKAVGNSSLSGSFLYSREPKGEVDRIRSICTPINLAEQEGFEDIYLWNMYLCPESEMEL